jgi:hypothetical protein
MGTAPTELPEQKTQVSILHGSAKIFQTSFVCFSPQLADTLKQECLQYAEATHAFCHIDWRVSSANPSPNDNNTTPGTNNANNNDTGEELGQAASDCNEQMLELRKLIRSLNQIRAGQEENSAQIVLSNLLRYVPTSNGPV